MQEEDLAAIEIKVCLVTVKTNLGSSSIKIVVGVVVLITSIIKIVKELIVFIKYKAFKLKIFRVAITITKRVRKSIEVIRQQ